MIEAIFFDWFNTLACYHPSREEQQSQALREFGIDVSPQQLTPAIMAADREYYRENAISPVRLRDPEEQARINIRYQKIVLQEAGVDTSLEPETLLKIMDRLRQRFGGMRFILYDDVLPALQELKEKDLTMGLLTNLDRDMKPICDQLGLEPYTDFIVTSGEVGVDKPDPAIFQAALQKAGVDASRAMHVGDHPRNDVIGAKNVGIKPVLIDRNDAHSEIEDCIRIHSLTELVDYLD